MKKVFLFSLAILFFLFIKVQPVSAITCVEGLVPNPLNPVYFEVKNDCGLWNWDKDCAYDEYCDYFGGWCAAEGGPCMPLDCAGCSVAENNQCVPQVKPPSTPNCCSRSCTEGGGSTGYSAYLFDQYCYDLTNIDNDANNCGTCGNVCTGGKVCTSGSCACPVGTEWDPVQNKCITPTCSPCIDGTECKDPPVCSSATPGNRCVRNPITNYGELQADPTCVGCVATFSITSGTGATCPVSFNVSGGCASKAFDIKEGTTSKCTGTTDASGTGSCSFTQTGSPVHTFDLWIDSTKKATKTGGGCTADTGGGGTNPPPPAVCNNNGVQDNGETGVDCGGGSCDACVSCPGSCGYISAWTGSCSTGCPQSYPNQQWTCVPGLPGGCGGRSGCASYDPTKGETPCSPSCGSFSICDKQSVCTSTGCKNVCTDPSYPKSGDTYCSKCNSCQDGIQNCGETIVDKCSTEPCTITTTTEYVKFSWSYCRDVCRNDGATCVAVMGSSGAYYPQGCSQGWTGNCKCSKTEDVFNPASCSDEVRNCAETCVDGSAQCNAGTKETDNTYTVSFEFSQPAELSGTNLYSDANSWNCMDGIDNDKDCQIDCADPDCSTSLACSDTTPPAVSVTGTPADWQNTGATASVACSDAESGCDASTYRLYTSATLLASCPQTYSSYTSSSPTPIASRLWVCAAAKDFMGNIGYSVPADFKIDTVPPITTISFDPLSPNSKGWYLQRVYVTLSCSDSPAGCKETKYRINGDAWITYAIIALLDALLI